MQDERRSGSIFVTVSFFGLTAGLVEGLGYLLLQHFHWLGWPTSLLVTAAPIIWIAPLFDLLLVGLLGLTLFVLSSAFPRLPIFRWSFFLLALFTLFDWLALSNHFKTPVCLILAVGLASAMTRWSSRHEQAVLRAERRALPWAAVATSLAFIGIQGGGWLSERIATTQLPKARPDLPNIVVVVLDAVRADRLSAYGYSRTTSPTMERLATQGVLFENAFSAASWTLPSHASLLTGQYPHNHGAEFSKQSLDSRFVTIPQELRNLGYRTGAFSGNNFYFNRQRGFGRGFLHFEDVFGSLADMASRTLYGREFNRFVLPSFGYTQIPGRKSASDVNRNALKWIDHWPSGPFFVFLNYFDAHDPYLPPESYRRQFSKAENSDRNLHAGLIDEFHFSIFRSLSAEQIKSEEDAYDASIRYIDDRLGDLVEQLEKRGLAKNTILVVTADHGEAFGEHGLLTHGNSLYAEELHVPLIFNWLGHLPAGVRIRQPVTNAALAGTLMDLVTGNDRSPFPGPPLSLLWRTPAQQSDWPDPIAEIERKYVPVMKNYKIYHGDMKSLITANWQYIQTQHLGDELYDRIEDPQELRDVAANPEVGKIKLELARRLQVQVSGEILNTNGASMDRPSTTYAKQRADQSLR